MNIKFIYKSFGHFFYIFFEISELKPTFPNILLKTHTT